MKTKQLAFSAILLSLAIVLSILEGFIPTLPMLPPGIKLGLSNIITMYALFFMGFPQALCIAFLKSVFVFLTRGITASILSFSGGLLSIIAMKVVLDYIKGDNYLVSIFGAIFHNIGQILIATVILKNKYTLYYIPIMFLSGIVAGTITGKTLSLIRPVLARVNGLINK